MSVSRDELHRLADALPERETRVVEFVLSGSGAEDEGWLEADLGELSPCDWGATERL